MVTHLQNGREAEMLSRTHAQQAWTAVTEDTAGGCTGYLALPILR